MLIALAITAILLTAIAVAFNASIINFNENQNIFKAINSARQALSRITTQVRTAEKVYVDGETVAQCSVETTDGRYIRYEYNSGDKTLYMKTNGNSYVLCKNVDDMRFDKTQSPKNSFAKNVQISMTIVSGDVRQTVSAAAVVRRNLD
jgi:Tfp pilus assembly protein PilW